MPDAPETPEAPEPVEEQAGQQDTPAGETPDDTKPKAQDGLKADLAKEREKRHAAETATTDTQAKLDAVLAALGLGEQNDDPAKAAEQYKAQAETAEAKLAVFTACPPGVDAAALLDSQAFLASLKDAPGDLAEHITQYAEANPRFKLAPSNGGARDAADRGRPPAPQKSMDDWIRGS